MRTDAVWLRAALLSGLLLFGFHLPAQAFVPPAPRLNVASYFLYEANSDSVLAEFEADKRLPMASLTKIMTAYIVVDQAKRNGLDLTAEIPVSKRAAGQIGSRTFVRQGSRVGIPDLLKGLAIQSGNDAAVVLAEHVGGTEEGFVDVMNSYARSLKMENTLYANATGLPSDREQYSSSRDLVKLTHSLIRDYPEHYNLYREKTFRYNDISQRNRNRLLWLDRTVDGVKTGHTQEAGWCLVSSAQRGEMRLIAVIMGAATETERNNYSRQLLEYGFRHFATRKVLEQNEVLERVDVWGGLTQSVRLGVEQDLKITLPRSDFERVEVRTEIEQQMLAPLEIGDVVGTVNVLLGDESIATQELIALERVRSLGFVGRTWARIRLLFSNLFGLE